MNGIRTQLAHPAHEMEADPVAAKDVALGDSKLNGLDPVLAATLEHRTGGVIYGAAENFRALLDELSRKLQSEHLGSADTKGEQQLQHAWARQRDVAIQRGTKRFKRHSFAAVSLRGAQPLGPRASH